MKVRLSNVLSLAIPLVLLSLTVPNLVLSQESKTKGLPESSLAGTEEIEGSKDFKSENSVDEFISKMSPEQKVGQLLMVGILENEMTSNLKTRIQNIKPGFLILFRKNIISPLQTSNLIYDIQKILLNLQAYK